MLNRRGLVPAGSFASEGPVPSMRKEFCMRAKNILIVLTAGMILSFASPAQASNNDNMGNARGLLDETIGVIVKTVASTYVNFYDFESKRAKALSALEKVDDKNFSKYYAQEYHHVTNQIPYEILPYCGIPSSMSKSGAISYVSSMSKERVKQIIDSVPNAIAGQCFRRLVSYKLHGNPSEAEVTQAANEYAQETINKLR